MSNDQKVVLILHETDVQEQNCMNHTHQPHMRIIELVRLLARRAAEQDFHAEFPGNAGEPAGGREE